MIDEVVLTDVNVPSSRVDRGGVTPGRSIVTAGIGCAVAAVLSFAVLAVVLLSAAVSMRRYGFSLRDRAEAPLAGAAFLGVAGLALTVAVVLLLRRRQVGRLSTVLVSASLLPVVAVMLWIIGSELDSRLAGAWLTPKALLGFGANARGAARSGRWCCSAQPPRYRPDVDGTGTKT